MTRKGIFKFNVLSFGLSNAPAIFQRLMDLVLMGLNWQICLAFLDDVIVMSSTYEQHLERLQQVFERFRGANLKLNAGKCHLLQEKVKFLGSIVSREGIAPDPEKIRAITEWPVPTDLKQVRGFVALASYYRKHIAHFADIARPLHRLSCKDAPWVWGPEQQQAFEELKVKLSTAPLVKAPLPEGQFVLDTDASDEGLGAALQQEQERVIVVIAYASRGLRKEERHYCTTRKELLAIVYGLKQFRPFLLGPEFLLRTDHAALTSLLKTPEPVGQQARWLDLLAEYHFKIQHRAGVQHSNADSLSRRPCDRTERQEPCKQCPKGQPVLYCPVDEVDVSPRQEVITTVSVPAREVSRSNDDLGDASRLVPELLLTPDQPSRANGVAILLSQGAGGNPVSEAFLDRPGDASGSVPGLLVIPDRPSSVNGVPVLLSPGASCDPDSSHVWDDPSVSVPELLLTPGRPSPASGASVLKPMGTGESPAPCGGEVSAGRLTPELLVAPGQPAPEHLDVRRIKGTAVSAGDTNMTMPISAEIIRKEQKEDRVLGKVIELLREEPESRNWVKAAGQSREVQDLWAQAASLVFVHDILYRQYVRPDGTILYNQLVIPESLRADVLRHVHGGTALGHFGVNKTVSMLQKYGYWTGWRKDVEMAVRGCDVCNRYRHGPRTKQGELQPQPSNFPMQKFHIDLTGPHVRSKNGFVYLFTGICNFTKYLIAVPIRDKTAITVARVLVKNVYLQYGAVDIQVSDNGGEFANEIAHELNEVMGIQGIHVTAYRASSNGVCERVHRSLHSVFAKTIAANQRNWCELVPYVTYAYNIATHSATTYSPFFLMFGREAKTPLNNLLEIPEDERQLTPESYAKEVTRNLAQAYDIVCDELNCKFDRAKQRYDSRVKSVQFKVGQFVWFFCPRRRAGLNPKWTNRNSGPHLIVKQHNLVNFSIQLTPRGDRVQIVHIDRLTPYRGEISADWRRQRELLVPREGEGVTKPLTGDAATEILPANGDTIVPSLEIPITPPAEQGLASAPDAGESGSQPEEPILSPVIAETPQSEAGDAPIDPRRVQPKRPRRKPARFRRLACGGSPPKTRASSVVNKIFTDPVSDDLLSLRKTVANISFNLCSERESILNQVRSTHTPYSTLSESSAAAAGTPPGQGACIPVAQEKPRAAENFYGQLHGTNTDSSDSWNADSDASYHTSRLNFDSDIDDDGFSIADIFRSDSETDNRVNNNANVACLCTIRMSSHGARRGCRNKAPPTLSSPPPLIQPPREDLSPPPLRQPTPVADASEEGELVCDVCGKHYRRNSGIRRHMIVQHGRSYRKNGPSVLLAPDELKERRHGVWLERLTAKERAAYWAKEVAAGRPGPHTPGGRSEPSVPEESGGKKRPEAPLGPSLVGGWMLRQPEVPPRRSLVGGRTWTLPSAWQGRTGSCFRGPFGPRWGRQWRWIASTRRWRPLAQQPF